MPEPTHISHKRMLQLVDSLIASGEIAKKTEFYTLLGVLKQNVHRFETGEQRFSLLHLSKVCKKFGCNANWVLGLEKNTHRDPVNKLVNKTELV